VSDYSTRYWAELSSGLVWSQASVLFCFHQQTTTDNHRRIVTPFLPTYLPRCLPNIVLVRHSPPNKALLHCCRTPGPGIFLSCFLWYQGCGFTSRTYLLCYLLTFWNSSDFLIFYLSIRKPNRRPILQIVHRWAGPQPVWSSRPIGRSLLGGFRLDEIDRGLLLPKVLLLQYSTVTWEMRSKVILVGCVLRLRSPTSRLE